MALENTKSLLQPDSIEAQQYRLQYSNLLGRVSDLQPAPAGSSAVAKSAAAAIDKPTSSKGVYTPVARALYFDGNTYLYSTGSQSDMLFGPQQRVLSFYMKPDLWDVGDTKQTIFHTYSGSFASQSLHVYMTGSNLRAEWNHNTTASYVQCDLLAQPSNRSQGNGYSYIRMSLVHPAFETAFFVGKAKARLGLTRYRRPIAGFTTTANNTHFSIGGTGAYDAMNFSGSIDDFAIFNRLLTSPEVVGIVDKTFTTGTISDTIRTYELHATSSDGLFPDLTGSNASLQFPLTGSANATITYTNSYY